MPVKAPVPRFRRFRAEFDPGNGYTH